MKQIRENNSIALCVPLKEGEKGGYIRGEGKAIIVQNKDVKKLLADNIPFFKQFWKDTNDPNYALLEIALKEIEYLKPGAFKVEKLSL
jgi:uncharacterized pyridoxamine 5'-phosphate oxidase family protein